MTDEHPGILEQSPARADLPAFARWSMLPILLGTASLVALAGPTPAPAPADPAQATPGAKASPDPDDPALAGRFAGRVVGPDGRPVAGARIYVVRDVPDARDPGLVRARTDADGRFAFDAPDMTFLDLDGLASPRQCVVIATAEGFAPDWTTTRGRTRTAFRSHSDPARGAEIKLRLAKDDVPIHGTLIDPRGDPVAGARVGLRSLMIPREHNLDAHILREANGSIFNTTDYLRSEHRPAILPGAATEATTDAEGRFILRGLGRDRIAQLEVSGPRTVDTDLLVMTRDIPDIATTRDAAGKPTRILHGAGFTLKLEDGVTVTGIVRDRDTRRPIPGMWVGPGGDAVAGMRTGSYPFSTDANGRFTITGVAPSLGMREYTAVPRPGTPYLMATASAEPNAEVVIECERGIPFHLNLTDEQGHHVEAEVSYRDVQPNPHMTGLRFHDCTTPISRARRRADGSYEGFALPGPGAVMVELKGRTDYRPAHVEPKAFFAPGRTNWTRQERISTYGTHDTLDSSGCWFDQHNYAAIVLVNPPEDSGPLELKATVYRDRPRQVSLVDPDGRPVVGARSIGLTYMIWDDEPVLRASTFPWRGQNPDRVRRVLFFHEARRLVGSIVARGDSDAPIVVTMRPWATLTGRLVAPDGKPLPALEPMMGPQPPAVLSMGDDSLVVDTDPTRGVYAICTVEPDGRFRVDRIVPGLRYSAEVYRGAGQFAGLAFENAILKPGEVRDLGDVRTKPPVNVIGK